MKLVALYIDGEVNWDYRSDVLAARVVDLVLRDELRAHAQGCFASALSQ